MESKTKNSINKRILNNFMDIIILKHLRENHPMSGYDVIRFLNNRFHTLPSSGTIYALLYSLERKNFVKGNMTKRKRVYQLTAQGERFLQDIQTVKQQAHELLSSILIQS